MDFEKDFDEWTFTECTNAAHYMRTMLEGQEWKFLSGIMAKQILARTDGIILQPLEKLDDAMKQEFAKGEVAALRLALSLPNTLLEQLDEAITQKREAQNARESDTSESDDE